MKLRHVVVATDFSVASTNAQRLAGRLATNHDARVWLVHVHDPAPFVGRRPTGDHLDTSDPDELMAGLESKLEGRRGEFLAEVDDVVCRVEHHPSSSNRIAALAVETGADLIVVGSHGRTGLGRAVLGSVAEQVVRDAPCPVLVARGVSEAAVFPRGVAVCTDFTEPSDAAVQLAATYAESCGRPLTVLHVYPSSNGNHESSPVERESVNGSFVQLGAKLQTTYQHRLGSRVEVAIRLLCDSDVAAALCSYAEEHRLELLVMATRGRSGLGRMLLGSVTDAVLRNAPCSVLTVKPTAST